MRETENAIACVRQSRSRRRRPLAAHLAADNGLPAAGRGHKHLAAVAGALVPRSQDERCSVGLHARPRSRQWHG
eukprot:380372-Rhodomonas_salina.4